MGRHSVRCDAHNIAALLTRNSEGAHDRLKPLLYDPCVLVRAAAVNALGRFLGGLERTEAVTAIENKIGISMVNVTDDASPLVRTEVRGLFCVLHLR